MGKSQSRRYEKEIYFEGNTVRNIDYEPEIKRTIAEPTRRNSHSIPKIRERDMPLQMDLPYVVILTIAAIVAMFICCNYLQVQSSITTSIKNIETQEKLLESVKNDNDALETRINTSVDLEHIYQVATSELGMVYANKNQVIKYDKTESEYVRQYENIPN